MLDKLLGKWGVKSPDQLKPAERETWRKWSEILAKPDVTIPDLKSFLSTELNRANHELHDFANDEKKEIFYKAYATFAENMLTAIGAPQREREQLRTFLRQTHGID